MMSFDDGLDNWEVAFSPAQFNILTSQNQYVTQGTKNLELSWNDNFVEKIMLRYASKPIKWMDNPIMSFDIYNPGNVTKVTVATELSEFTESKWVFLQAGMNKVVLDFRSSFWKSNSTGWNTNIPLKAELLNDLYISIFLVNQSSGIVWLDNMRFTTSEYCNCQCKFGYCLLGSNCRSCFEGHAGPNCESCTCKYGNCNNSIHADLTCTLNSCLNGWAGVNCDEIVSNLNNSNLLWIILAFGIVLIIIVAVILRYYLRSRSIDALPDEIRQLYFNHTTWKHVDKLFYRKHLNKGSSEYDYIQKLFCELGGKDITIESIYIIYNPTLTNNFANRKGHMAERVKNDPRLFMKKGWQKDDPDELREWIISKFESKVKSWKWNEASELSILPVLHGTDAEVGWKICKTGYAALPSQDAGWYGRGIYFTSNAEYASPYYHDKSKPCILINLVLPGNPYPVTESSDLSGKPLMNGYQSHYVHTKKEWRGVLRKGGNILR
jgi:hypothetical protein